MRFLASPMSASAVKMRQERMIPSRRLIEPSRLEKINDSTEVEGGGVAGKIKADLSASQ